MIGRIDELTRMTSLLQMNNGELEYFVAVSTR